MNTDSNHARAALSAVVNRQIAAGSPVIEEVAPATIDCCIPFGGFCDSIHSSEIDQAVDMMLTDHDSGTIDAPQAVTSLAHDGIKYGQVYLKYANAYAVSFLDWLGLAGEFDAMESPREYNFETDRLFVKLTAGDVATMWQDVDKEAFTQACRDRFTHRSGFISHYSPNHTTWGELAEWDHNQIGTLIGVIAESKYIDETCSTGWDQFAEYALVEDCSGNGDFDSWIQETAGPELERALTIWDYLQERAKRPAKRECILQGFMGSLDAICHPIKEGETSHLVQSECGKVSIRVSSHIVASKYLASKYLASEDDAPDFYYS